MPKDIDQRCAFSVESATRMFQIYHDPYHLSYPWFIANGYSPSEISKAITTDIDIVEFHLDRYFGTFVDFDDCPNKTEIIFDALERAKQLGPLEISVLTKSVEGPVLEAQKPEVAITAKEEEVIADIEVEKPKRACPPPPEYVLPTRNEVAASIKALTHAERVILDMLVANHRRPSNQYMSTLLERKTAAAAVALSKLYKQLNLTGSRHDVHNNAWHEQRFKYLYAIYHSEGFRPQSAK